MSLVPTDPAPLKTRVAYFYDEDVGSYAYNLVHPMKPHRIKMAHSLIVNTGLVNQLDVLRPKRATAQEMTRFHTDEYIDFLTRVSPEMVEEMTGHGSRFLIGEDCPAFDGLYEFCSISAGGSLSAARRLISGKADIAVNWAGGLHHAKKREASGFCYVNDIVLSILELLRYHSRVLYIDIDVHHGDGVEEAFYTTDRVMTCSFHKFGDFFPGTGQLSDRGHGRGKGYAVNVPLHDGIDDETYKNVFVPVIRAIMEWYRPGAVVLQCGADSLAEDKLGPFNLSMRGHASCVAFLRSFNVPMVLVGGGGYTIRNVARTWAFEVGVAAGVELDKNLPFDEYMEYYGPEFKLDVPCNNMENHNSREYLQKIASSVIDGLRNMPFAPSVQTQPVPPDEDEGDSDSDLDVAISGKLQQTRPNVEYPSDDDDPDMYLRQRRRADKSYLHAPPSHVYSNYLRGSSEKRRERQAAAAAADAMDEDDNGHGGVYAAAAMAATTAAPPRHKRSFFKSGTLDLAKFANARSAAAMGPTPFLLNGHGAEEPNGFHAHQDVCQ